MALNDAAKNVMLDALGAVVSHVSLHSADPGASGTDELAGGSPAYSREAIAWASAASGSMSKTASDPVFDVEGGDTVSYVGFWSASTAGTFYGSANVTDEVYGGQGTYTLTAATISLT